MKKLSHVNKQGEARMVDVGAKPVVAREATAEAKLVCSVATIRLLKKSALPKGDVLAVARVAGIQAAKQTAALIPLCHVLPLDSVQVDFEIKTRGIKVHCTARTQARTGVEMEALVAVTAAGLCLYDMAKSIDPSMSLTNVQLEEKRGGVHGDYLRSSTTASDAAS